MNNETFEQSFDVKKDISQIKPLDQFEKAYIEMENIDKKESGYHMATQEHSFKKQIMKEEKKLLQLKRDFELLKNHQFEARRGRNNKVFYRAFTKNVYDYESDDMADQHK